ncbi:MAG: hypothetical protein NTY94_03895, partial [Alphaproteobacteria bacterium]|nr:hypothetical protein [Alphaproteobacteria bacterium]
QKARRSPIRRRSTDPGPRLTSFTEVSFESHRTVSGESSSDNLSTRPNFSSIVKESTEILREFQKTLGEKK